MLLRNSGIFLHFLIKFCGCYAQLQNMQHSIEHRGDLNDCCTVLCNIDKNAFTLFRYRGRVWPKIVRKRLYMLSSTLLSIKLVGTRGWCWFLYQRLTVLLQKADSEKPTEKSKQEENNAKYLGALKVTIHFYPPSILHLKWHLFRTHDMLTSSLT